MRCCKDVGFGVAVAKGPLALLLLAEGGSESSTASPSIFSGATIGGGGGLACGTGFLGKT